MHRGSRTALLRGADLGRPTRPALARSPFVYIDAHILATPAIADLDGDGAEELVVAVSYFYDRQYYEKEVGQLLLLRGRGFTGKGWRGCWRHQAQSGGKPWSN